MASRPILESNVIAINHRVCILGVNQSNQGTKVMSIYIPVDIETIPDQTPGALQTLMDTVEVKPPSGATKPMLGKDLGLSGDEIKFTAKGELEKMWIDAFAESKKEECAIEQWLKTSFDGSKGQICAISFRIDGESIDFHDSCNPDLEADMLRRFWEAVNSDTRNGSQPYFVAHYAKFDLPFLYHRSVILGVKIPVKLFPHARSGRTHFCTMEGWAGYNNSIKLDVLAKCLGLIGKDMEGMDGSKVWPEYELGNIEKISRYCGDDVRILDSVYRKMMFLG